MVRIIDPRPLPGENLASALRAGGGAGGSSHHIHQPGFGSECPCQGLVECGQGRTVVPRQRNEVMVSDLICAAHQVRAHNPVFRNSNHPG